VEIADPDTPKPYIREIYDFAINDFATEFASGSLIEIKGSNFRMENLSTHVFLKLKDTEDRLEIPLAHRVTDKNILCNLPADLEAGEYKLTVVLGEDDDADRGSYKTWITIT